MTIEKRKNGNVEAESFLISLLGSDLTFVRLIYSISESENINLTDFSKRLGISKQNLCDIEKNRKSVNPSRAVKWAKILGYSEELFIKMALEEFLIKEGIKKYRVDIRPKKAA
jgi:transcriptional regulator with XRE-family HTH domain